MQKSDLGSIKFLRIKYGPQTNPFSPSFKRMVFIKSFWYHVDSNQEKFPLIHALTLPKLFGTISKGTEG